MNIVSRVSLCSRSWLRGWLAATGLAIAAAATTTAAADAGPETRRVYLSGHGPKDAVPWEFFCTAGRRSGTWTTIPVPSQWEQHGFGGYDYGQGSARRAEERGLYRRRFAVPREWAGSRVRIVFDGVMTDTTVKVNGKSAGPVHVGGFYRFRHDITELLQRDGDNLLEVDVAKVSAVRETEIAERHGDYWVFGGIYRPVFLEAVPPQSIDQVSIDAKADGMVNVDLELALPKDADADAVECQVLTPAGEPVGGVFRAALPGGGAPRVRLHTNVAAPATWSAETPRLYHLRATLRAAGTVRHVVTTRFGFRTFEIRPGAGLFLNGARIVLKGVNRHSFRADTGRALNPEDCYADVRLIQAMNMNAVRMSHYPPDEAFLEACDELGLYVLDELSGWQRAHDTETGRRLVREMVTRDVNHPSILFWDNGNEGGWNRALDVEFSRYDPQARPVLHPWETLSGIDTVHYRSYADMAARARGPHLIMPTEFLHGLFDGGAGAGLDDYWPLLSAPPHGAGGFIWVLADEGIARTDQAGRIDTWSTYGPDGIVGPRHEREASFDTVREIFSPVQMERPPFTASSVVTLRVHNRYSFTTLDACRLRWRTLQFPPSGAPTTQVSGEAKFGAIAPGASGDVRVELPPGSSAAEALAVTVSDPQQRELWTWVWPTPALASRLATGRIAAPQQPAPALQADHDVITLRAAGIAAAFDAHTGLLREISRDGVRQPLANGPRFVRALPVTSDQKLVWTTLERDGGDATAMTYRAGNSIPANLVEVKFETGAAWYGARIDLSDGAHWRTVFNGTRRSNDGDRYAFSPQDVRAVRVTELRRSDGEPARLRSVRLGHAPGRFASGDSELKISTGTSDQGGAPAAWVEAKGATTRFRWSLRADGSLQLDYTYRSVGPHLYRGITFDALEEGMKRFQWLGLGPHRVWQNRIRGATFGWHEHVRSVNPGAWDYPQFAGYFGDVRSLRLDTTAGTIAVSGERTGTFYRVGTVLTDHPNTTVDFPPGDLSVLDAIPAMGSKFRTAAESGPSGAPAVGPETFTNTLVLRFTR